MTDPGYDACLVEAELRARSSYAEFGRRYHGLEHLDDCLAQLDAIAGLSDHERRLLGWAILWHDAIYDPERTDNEEASAELAREELLGCGVAAEDAAEVARLIRLTKDHEAEDGDRLAEILVSIDLSILGSRPASYAAYVAGVRAEYAHVGDDAWRAGRSAVLERLLARDPLYPDNGYRQRLESQARLNIEEELRQLGGG